jgi:glycosyltransferase involved in cell wall biosynthesis
MRIAMVSEHASPFATLGGADAGGQNVHVAELARALAARGAEVVVHTRRDDPRLPRRVPFAPGVLVEHVDAGPVGSIPKDALLPHMDAFACDLEGSWRHTPPDVVHAHFWMSGLAALQAARPLDIPVVQTFHALGVEKRRMQGVADTSPPERIELEARVAREVDAVIATASQEVFSLRRLGTSAHRVTVIPCGVDLERFARPSRRPCPGTRARLLWLGRLVERKGVATIIEALPSSPSADLVVAGGPPRAQLQHDSEYRRLRRLAESLGVSDRVCFEGRVDREQAARYMRSADIAVCVPWYEPFGIVPLEAMASGVPVIGSAVGGLLDTVVHRVTGLHVPPRDPARLSRAINELVADAALRARLGDAGAARARALYGWDRIAGETLAVYAAAVAGEALDVTETVL